jgi:ABC-2 type transport system permease protein
VLNASLFIILFTAKNRVRRWFKRLREPRYLIGALVGFGYLWFVVYARYAASGGRPRRPPTALFTAWPELATYGPTWGGMAILIAAALAWILPATGALLVFTQPEEQFLFPAPVTRRQLLAHRMMRSQLGILFASSVSAVAFPTGAPSTRLRTALSVWVLFFTSRVYLSGVTLAKARLKDQDRRVRLGARLSLAFVSMAAVFAGIGFVRAARSAPIHSFADVFTRVDAAQLRQPDWLLFLPFLALAKPFFTVAWSQFAPALAGALAVLVVSMLWVFANDAAFQDIATETTEQRRNRPQRGRGTAYRVRQAGWTLAPTGRPEAAFAWKSALQTFRVVDRRILLRIVGIVIWISIIVSSLGRTRGLAAAGGMLSLSGALLAMLLGPLALRIDLRQDLHHLELLKTWPLRAAAVVRGEMLWPAAMLTAVGWTLVTAAWIFSHPVFPQASAVMRFSVAVAAALAMPAVIATQFTIHNAAALFFPAWMASGIQRGRGVDAIGQRLILVGGTVLLLAIALTPGVLGGGIVFLAFRPFIGPAALIPAAAIGTAIVLFEVLIGTEMLGPVYERLDILAIERTE